MDVVQEGTRLFLEIGGWMLNKCRSGEYKKKNLKFKKTGKKEKRRDWEGLAGQTPPQCHREVILVHHNKLQ